MTALADASTWRSRYQREGYFVVDEVVNPTQVAALREVVDAQWEVRRAREARASEGRWDRLRPELPRLHRLSAAALDIILAPAILEIVAELIGPDADMMWNQAHVKAPDEDGMTAIPWHQDGAYAKMEHPDTLSVWVALQPCNETNGGLAFCPGSHAQVVEHEWDEELKYFGCRPTSRIERPSLDTGQAVVFHARCIHGSPPNRGRANRAGYSMSFGLPGARLLPSRTLFGDQLPVLRGGRDLREVMREWAASEGRPCAGATVLEELRLRAPRGHATIERAAARWAQACSAGDPAKGNLALFELMAISEDDETVNGDLVRARTDASAIERELSEIGGSLSSRERELLCARLLELDPDSELARAGLALSRA